MYKQRNKIKVRSEIMPKQCTLPQRYYPMHANPVTARTIDSNGIEEVHEQCSLRLKPNHVSRALLLMTVMCMHLFVAACRLNKHINRYK